MKHRFTPKNSALTTMYPKKRRGVGIKVHGSWRGEPFMGVVDLVEGSSKSVVLTILFSHSVLL